MYNTQRYAARDTLRGYLKDTTKDGRKVGNENNLAYKNKPGNYIQ